MVAPQQTKKADAKAAEAPPTAAKTTTSEVAQPASSAMEQELLTLQQMSEQVLEEYAELRQAHDDQGTAMHTLQSHYAALKRQHALVADGFKRLTADIAACRHELLVAARDGEALQAAHHKARKELRGMTTLLQQKDREVRKGEMEREKLQTELVEAIRQRNAFHQLSLQRQQQQHQEVQQQQQGKSHIDEHDRSKIDLAHSQEHATAKKVPHLRVVTASSSSKGTVQDAEKQKSSSSGRISSAKAETVARAKSQSGKRSSMFIKLKHLFRASAPPENDSSPSITSHREASRRTEKQQDRKRASTLPTASSHLKQNASSSIGSGKSENATQTRKRAVSHLPSAQHQASLPSPRPALPPRPSQATRASVAASPSPLTPRRSEDTLPKVASAVASAPLPPPTILAPALTLSAVSVGEEDDFAGGQFLDTILSSFGDVSKTSSSSSTSDRAETKPSLTKNAVTSSSLPAAMAATAAPRSATPTFTNAETPLLTPRHHRSHRQTVILEPSGAAKHFAGKVLNSLPRPPQQPSSPILTLARSVPSPVELRQMHQEQISRKTTPRPSTAATEESLEILSEVEIDSSEEDWFKSYR